MQISKDQKSALVILCAAAFLVPFMGSSINLSLPQISDALSMKAVSLSWIATAYLITTAVFQVPFARFSPSLLATLGMLICTFGLGALVFLSPEPPLYLIFILFILLGLGFGLFSSPNTNLIMSFVDRKYYGQASATMGTMRLTGHFSMGIAMMALSLFVRNLCFGCPD